MKIESVGEVIADRELTLNRQGHEPAEIHVLMGKPQRLPDHTDHYCPYQINWLGREKVMAICGVDAFQAMQLALDTIGVEIEVIAKDSGGKIMWDAGSEGDLGFPRPYWKREKSEHGNS
jgi:hypothetical protein